MRARKSDEHKKNTTKRIVKNRQKQCRNYVDEYKKLNPCIRCGEKESCCLQFHHRDPSTKFKSIHYLKNSYTLSRVKIEVEKCDILCANCHRKEHYDNVY